MDKANDFRFDIASRDNLSRIVDMKIAMFLEAGDAALLAPNARDIIADDYARLYAEGNARHFVALANNNIVACAGAFIKMDLPFRYFNPPAYGFIGDVYTEPEYRGRGLATKLNHDALGWLRTREVKMVRLLSSDAGRHIYEKLGFKPTDEMALVLTKHNALAGDRSSRD